MTTTDPVAGSSSRLTPPPLQTPTPASVQDLLDDHAISPTGKDSDVRPAVVLRHALQWAIKHADVELVKWLTGLTGRWAEILDAEVAVMEDDDGWGVIGMAIQASCGRHDKEEAVRLLVGRWGVCAGPREGRDRAGWTVLHLAALLSTPQIVSVLLNNGASPAALTHTGLSAFDLISDMDGRESLAVLLDPLHVDASPTAAVLASPTDQQLDHTDAERQGDEAPGLNAHRAALLRRRRVRAATRGQRAARQFHKVRVQAERERWVRARAKHIGVDASVLFEQDAPKSKAPDDDDDEDTDDEHDYEDMDVDINERLEALNTESLVFSVHQLTDIFDIFISQYRPVCQPRTRRSLPANALFLYARFAHYRCDETWLEELLEGSVERIERGVYDNGDDLAYLAFWEFNLTKLLYLLRTDEGLCQICSELNLLTMMEELINAIHVFIIRIAERTIDEMLDAAMLDFEPIDDFEDVRFTDEWRFLRTLGIKKSKQRGDPGSANSSMPTTPVKARSNAALGRPTSITDLGTEAKEVIASGLASAQAVFSDKPTPRQVADVLTSVLLILQLYDVNPAFIVQVFSQTFFWIANELFNRIITRKKYLCRSKAVQIRMNITVIEDWTRSNGLPPSIASKHLEPTMQLLQWLQCASQINEFDMLIGTVQGLRSLNPLQMRRAVRDYRYEVNEGRMADDCLQYLSQLQRDWERRRVHKAMQTQKDPNTAESAADEGLPIEALFDGSASLAEWMPATSPECMGELLDSRYMLPFLVPQNATYLLAMPPPDAAFQNLMTERPLLPDGSIASRPLSIASYSSSKPMGWVTPTETQIRELPEDFFSWLREQQRDRDQTWSLAQVKEQAVAAAPDMHETPTHAARGSATPTKRDKQASPLRVRTEHDADEDDVENMLDSPPPSLPPKTSVLAATPPTPSKVAGSAHGRKLSADMAFRGLPGDPTSPMYETIELRPRQSNGDMAALAALARAQPSTSPTNGHVPHYELARHRREKQSSISSMASVQSLVSNVQNFVSPAANKSAGAGTSPDAKRRWWNKVGRKSSSGSISSVTGTPDDPRRREREDSADTITPSRPQRPQVFPPAPLDFE